MDFGKAITFWGDCTCGVNPVQHVVSLNPSVCLMSLQYVNKFIF